MDIDPLILYNKGMPDLIFRIPQITDKRIFDKYLEKSRPHISEMTFTNIFMWRNVYNYMYAELDGLLWIKYQKPGAEESYFMPLGDLTEEAFRAGLRKQNGLFFSAVTEDQFGLFKSAARCEFLADRDNWDYLYNTSDLVHLPGKKYDGKRNHIHRFEREHDFSVEKITPDNIANCREIMDAWVAQTFQKNVSGGDGSGGQGPGSDYAAVIELLENYSALGCRGILIKVDGVYAAFTIGEMQNGNTAVIHVEKAVRGIPGLYQFINRQFCMTEWQDTAYVNREQDMGIPGLRRSKESYHPVKYVEKYRVRITY